MNIQELRIGNRLNDKAANYEFKVVGIDTDNDIPHVHALYESGVVSMLFPEETEPLMLTEDWLLRAGFETRGDFNITTFYKGENPITKDYLFSLVWLKNNPEPFYRNGYHKIKYVHQLQNLYFALTGEELTFAENHNPCTSPDPDDMCDHCNCWKSTRSNCS